METNQNRSQTFNIFQTGFPVTSNAFPNNSRSVNNNPFSNCSNTNFPRMEQMSSPNIVNSSRLVSTEKNNFLEKNIFLAEKPATFGMTAFPTEIKQYKRTNMNLPEIDFLNIAEPCKFLYEEFQCVICHTLVKISNPKECSKCSKIFCGECIETWLTTNEKCPCCRSISTSRKISNKILLNILDKIEIICNLCKNTFRLSIFSKHYTTCEKGLYECMGKDCNFKAYKETIEEHVNTCQKVEEKCNLCNHNVTRNLKKTHYEIQCLGMEVKCVCCKTSMKRKDFIEEHTKDKCLYIQLVKKDSEISELKSQVEKLTLLVLNTNEKYNDQNQIQKKEEDNKIEISEK